MQHIIVIILLGIVIIGFVYSLPLLHKNVIEIYDNSECCI